MSIIREQRPTKADYYGEIPAELQTMTLEELKARWLQLKGIPLPKFMRRGLMTRAVAHAMDEAANGGLDPATQRKLDELVAAIVPKNADGKQRAQARKQIKPGTRLIREWQGDIHEVTVTPKGFLWRGAEHASLSAIAREITGTRWNGWAFFGLKKKPTAASRTPSSAGTALPQATRRSPKPLARERASG